MSLSIILVIVAVVAFLIGWLHVSHQRRQRRRLEVLGAAACPTCGTPYGVAAAEQAREDFLAHCAESRRRLPHCKINFVRYWQIRCAGCGAEARFHYDTQTLATLPDSH